MSHNVAMLGIDTPTLADVRSYPDSKGYCSHTIRSAYVHACYQQQLRNKIIPCTKSTCYRG